jgi:hypothetical protein
MVIFCFVSKNIFKKTNMEKIIKIMCNFILLFIIFSHGCKEESNIYYIDSNAPAPEPISDIKVESTPGGAIITYKIPKDKNLSYVKAVYEIQPGVYRETKSSYYRDTLDLVGFGDTLSHKVGIYSVGRNEKMSAPLFVDVKPLTPPVLSVFETLDLKATFGGVNVAFENESEAKLAINVIMDSTGIGNWLPLMTHYTGAKEGKFSVRGMDPKERIFGVYIRDRWYHKSDTLVKVLTPLYEELIPKKSWKALHLPGDSWEPDAAKYSLENVWDDIVNNSENLFASRDWVKKPQWFTVDLNQTVIFSRMKLFQRTSHPYNAAWVKTFEIWGTTEYNPDGSWDNWMLLGRFDSRIPSGSVWPVYTADDMEYQKRGEDFEFEQPLPEVRYIRFKLIDTYGGTGKYHLAELTFWGQIFETH